MQATTLLKRLTGHGVDDLVAEDEVLEELFAEGIDVDEIVAGARRALRRIQDKPRVLGVPVNDNDMCDEGDDS